MSGIRQAEVTKAMSSGTHMVAVSDLRTEYALNPLGLDCARPCFSWKIRSDQPATSQTAFRVRVASAPELLTQSSADLWDSGIVQSPQSINIEYAGRALQSGERCHWLVEIWDNHGQSASSTEPAWFEMGLLKASDWKARWIGYSAGWVGRALQFRRTFELSGAIRRARAYVTGLGYYEVRLNGKKVGDHVLEPGWTAFDKRVLYTTYDVTDLLRAGKNVVGALVGHGWYGDRKLFLQINIEFADGTTGTVTSDWGWQVSASPIVSDGIYDGEVYDARLERQGWDTPAGELPAVRDRTQRWSQAMVVEAPAGRLVASSCEPIKVVETLRAVSLIHPRPGVWVYDLGRNIAGWARIRVSGPAGTSVALRFAETLHEDGTANQDNLRGARAEDIYILKGEALEEWEPRFTYHGFRYVQVNGWPGKPKLGDLDGRVVRSSVAPRGSFLCDHALINQIQETVNQTEVSNLHSVPTDCPQRDERLGWLNDLTARGEGAIYNFDLVRFYRKWLDDIADAQDANGAIPDTVPYRFCHRPADPVCVCFLLLPWLMYQHYGDLHTLRKHYHGMKAWVECLRSQASEHILSLSHWGDWAPPIHRKGLNVAAEDTPWNRDTPPEVISTGFYAYSAGLLSKIAETLHIQDDAAAYRTLNEQIVNQFNARFWNEALGGYGSGNQSCNSAALYLGMVPPGRVQRVAQSLIRDIVDVQGGHLATGNICTKYILEALTDTGHADVAMNVAARTTYPSWGYMLANGATTIWERWERAAGDGMNSHNHPMLGSITAWFYRALAGLRVDLPVNQCLRFVIQPTLVEGLNAASAELETMAGRAATQWRRTASGFEIDVEVPVNCSAILCVPNTTGTTPLVIRMKETIIWSERDPARCASGVTPGSNMREAVRVELASGRHCVRVEREPTIETTVYLSARAQHDKKMLSDSR